MEIMMTDGFENKEECCGSVAADTCCLLFQKQSWSPDVALASARAYLQSELEKGPIAPALIGPMLRKLGLAIKVGSLIAPMSDVMMITEGRESPVGYPALALKSRSEDRSYWTGYRLRMLDQADQNIDIDLSVLKAKAKSFPLLTVEEFETFKIGTVVKGVVSRLASSGEGFIVDVLVGETGAVKGCYMPVPDKFRNKEESLVGREVEAKVYGAKCETQSVLLTFYRVLGADDTSHRGGGVSTFATLEEDLAFYRRLMEQHELTATGYEALCRRALGK